MNRRNVEKVLLEYSKPVTIALRALERQLVGLKSVLEDARYLSDEVGPLGPGPDENRERWVNALFDGMAKIRYDDDDEVNKIEPILGVVGVKAAGIARIHEINAAKQKLADVLRPLAEVRVKSSEKDGKGGYVVKQVPIIRKLMRRIEAGEVSLLAAYRQIPVLLATPKRITFSEFHNRVIYKLSRQELMDRLDELGDEKYLEDKELVKTVRDKAFAHLKTAKSDVQLRVRSTVTYTGLDVNKKGRVQLACTLPLFWNASRVKEAPIIRYPTRRSPEEVRAKEIKLRKLRKNQFLTNMSVYRYQESTNAK